MATISFKPYGARNTGTFFYGHAGSTNINLTTLNSGLCGVFTAFAFGVAQYTPFDQFPLFTNMTPNSAYLLFVKGTTTFSSDESNVFPTTYTVKPGVNFIAIDKNAIALPMSATPMTTSNTDVVYGTFDATDFRNLASEPSYEALKFLNVGIFTPDIVPNTPMGNFSNTITLFRPGSAYLIAVKAGAAPFNITYLRKSQYIITNAGNTAPTGPGFIITCENGDRLTTGVVG